MRVKCDVFRHSDMRCELDFYRAHVPSAGFDHLYECSSGTASTVFRIDCDVDELSGLAINRQDRTSDDVFVGFSHINHVVCDLGF